MLSAEQRDVLDAHARWLDTQHLAVFADAIRQAVVELDAAEIKNFRLERELKEARITIDQQNNMIFGAKAMERLNRDAAEFGAPYALAHDITPAPFSHLTQSVSATEGATIVQAGGNVQKGAKDADE